LDFAERQDVQTPVPDEYCPDSHIEIHVRLYILISPVVSAAIKLVSSLENLTEATLFAKSPKEEITELTADVLRIVKTFDCPPTAK
jgi:hypothetical protein